MADITKLVETFEKQIVNYKAYNLAHMTIMRSIQATQMRGKPSCVVLEAPSGCGKTTLGKQIEANYPPLGSGKDSTGAWNTRPTILCGLPTKATINTFAKAMLKELRFEAYSGDAWELTERVIQQIKEQRVEVVILDEIQMLSNKKSDQAKIDVMNCITRLVDRTGIPFVAQGEEGIKEFFSSSALAHRFPFYAKLYPLHFDLSPTSDWQLVLSGLDKKLYEIGNLKRGVHLQEPHIAAALFAASGGILEDLRIDLSNAFINALQRGDGTFLLDDLSNAFYIIEHPNCLCLGENPFELTSKNLLELIEK